MIVSLSKKIKGLVASAAPGVAGSDIVVFDKVVSEWTESSAPLLVVPDDIASDITLLVCWHAIECRNLKN